MRLRATFAALLALSALAARAEDPPAGAALPSFAELEAAGAVIGEIRIEADDVFDLDDPAENNWLFRLANRIHIQTRPDVIRNQLLFRSGEKLVAQRVLETERLLRGNRYLYEASIRPVAGMCVLPPTMRILSTCHHDNPACASTCRVVSRVRTRRSFVSVSNTSGDS